MSEGDCSFSTKLGSRIKPARDWEIEHNSHLKQDELFQLEDFPHPSGLWKWVVCPCGAKLLTIAEVIEKL